MRELEVGARLVRQDICGPIWANDDDGQTATVNAKRSFGDFWVTCKGAAAPRRTGCTPSGFIRAARCPSVHQRRNPAPGPPPGPSDYQGSGRWVVFLLAGFDPPVFFLWGYLKLQVYKGWSRTVAELEEAVEQEVWCARVATCRAVMENAWKRVELCLRENGDHLEQVLQLDNYNILTPTTKAQ